MASALPFNASVATLALAASVDTSAAHDTLFTLAPSVRTPKSALLIEQPQPVLVVLPPFGPHLRVTVRVELVADTGKGGKEPPAAAPAPLLLLRTLTLRYQSRLRPGGGDQATGAAGTAMACLCSALVNREHNASQPLTWEEVREMHDPYAPDPVAENAVLRVTKLPRTDDCYELAFAHHGVLAFLAADIWPSTAQPKAPTLFVGRGSYAVRVVENAQSLKPMEPALRPHDDAVDRVVLRALGGVTAIATRRLVRAPGAPSPVPLLDNGSGVLFVPSLLLQPHRGSGSAPAPAVLAAPRAARRMTLFDEPRLLRPPLLLWGELGRDCLSEAVMTRQRPAVHTTVAPSPPPSLPDTSNTHYNNDESAGGSTVSVPPPKRKLAAVSTSAALEHTLAEANSRKRRRLVMDTLEYTLFTRALVASNVDEILQRFSKDIFATWAGNGCPHLRSNTVATTLRAHAIGHGGFAPYSSSIRAFDQAVAYFIEHHSLQQ